MLPDTVAFLNDPPSSSRVNARGERNSKTRKLELLPERVDDAPGKVFSAKL